MRFGGCIHERLKGFHCAWVPACAWGLRTGSIGYAESGWRVVTSMRSVADLLVSRSCNETHWHRPVEGTFPPAASLSHLCRRLMSIVLRRPAPMELAELVAGATIKRRLRSKQTIQRRLTKKPPSSGNSFPQSSDPATETVPDGEEHPVVPDRIELSKLEEHPVVPERTEPWRPLTENEKDCVECTLSRRERSVRRPGSQIAWRTWAFRHQGHSGQSASKSCSSNSAGGRQTHALHGLPGECQNVISSCHQWKGHGTWSSPADGQFLLETSLKEVHVKGTLLVDASSRAAVIRIWRTAPRQELLGNVSASEARQMLQESCRFGQVWPPKNVTHTPRFPRTTHNHAWERQLDCF